MEDSQKIEEQVQEEVILDNGTEKKQETRDEMLSQHSSFLLLSKREEFMFGHSMRDNISETEGGIGGYVIL
ncbi:hypothetical protein Ahy_B04g069807 isoform B [Arachis hypogaea]|uniref:Uncharacterized protein n=1 Tax=Arachis hypogaea TaxID=3818 RepID=A0A444ZDN4_ARAHY|nr:hypothetical protein Ahy_B04g069807 isoform B [Arachis hypogaea]